MGGDVFGEAQSVLGGLNLHPGQRVTFGLGLNDTHGFAFDIEKVVGEASF